MSALDDAMGNGMSPLEKLEAALQDEAIGGANKKESDFLEAYEVMERSLAMKVSQKKVLEQFNAAYGHHLHPPRFRKMLDAERTRRAGSGTAPACKACGRPLATVQVLTEDAGEDT